MEDGDTLALSCQHATACAPGVARVGRRHALRADDAAVLQPLHEVRIARAEGPAEAGLQDLQGVVGRAGLLCLEGMLSMAINICQCSEAILLAFSSTHAKTAQVVLQ